MLDNGLELYGFQGAAMLCLYEELTPPKMGEMFGNECLKVSFAY